MTRPIAIDRDYRKVIIPRWVEQEVSSFPRPTPAELGEQARYYHPLVDRYLPADHGAAVLELGCGFGSFLRALKDRGYTNVKAMDLIRECCDYVEKEIGVPAECGDLFDFLARDEGRYDAIVAFDVLEHFNKNEIVGIVERLHEILDVGGVLVLRVPNGSSLAGLSTRYSGFTHETAFTKASISELLKAMGFQDIECLPDPIYARTPLRGAVKRVARWAAERVLSVATMRMVPAAFTVSQNITAVARKR
jgi:2-polyprenyl-3-methyl-5-hydroxy-6-metoxy-1,4-benzoquinol methylase